MRKGFNKEDGPFVRALDRALSSFNVERQAYYSGTFVGNHVHRTLKVYRCMYMEIHTYSTLAYVQVHVHGEYMHVYTTCTCRHNVVYARKKLF